MRGIFGVLVLLVGCGSDPAVFGGASPADAGPEADATAQVCQPGQQVGCACPGGSDGAQRCRDDGSGWEACDCPDASTGFPDAVADAVADVAVDSLEEDAFDGAIDVEADAPNWCGKIESTLLTCSKDCAECVDVECDLECNDIYPGATNAFTCYCGCSDDACFAACDAWYVPVGTIATYYSQFTECIRSNCPPACDPRPEAQ